MAKGELHSVETKDDGFMTQLRLGKSYLHGVDAHERPICVVRTRLHHSSDQRPEALERFTVWDIKGWLDPVVAAKIHFTRSAADLEKFIPKSRIVKELEGDEDFEYKYVEPVPGENDLMKDTATRDKIQEERNGMVERFEQVTKQWIKGEDVSAERDALANELNANYWKLDPYIRARTLYDRIGAIGERGGFVYSKTEETKVEKTQASE